MAKVTSQQAADKWRRRITAATQDIQNGVNAVTDSPMAKAAGKQEKLLNNFTQAVQSGKWAAGLQKVNLQDWKRATIEKGIPRIAQGAQEGQGKVEAFMGELLPHIDSGMSRLNSMPDLTLQDSIQRASYWITHMANFKRR